LFSYEDDVEGPNGRLPTKVRLQPGENRFAYEALLEDPFNYRDKKYRSTKVGKGLAQIFKALEQRVDPSLPQVIQAEEYKRMLRRLLREVEIVTITGITSVSWTGGIYATATPSIVGSS
jgi:hypothetical protein